jgi:transportin-1
VALGPGFGQFAIPVYKHTHRLTATILFQDQQYQNGIITDAPDKEFLVAALDLMSGLVQGMGESLGDVIAQTDPPLVQLLVHCLEDHIDDVRQSGFALLGDFAMILFQLLVPNMQQIMTALIPQIEFDGRAPSVVNNAAWAAGEIAIQLGAQFRPYVQHILPRLVLLMNASNTPGPVLENAAIAIGRTGLVCPDDVARELPVFAAAFIRALKDVRDNEEKDSAFRGFCTLIGKNPSGLSGDLTNFVIAVAKYSEPSPELADMFHTVLSPLLSHEIYADGRFYMDTKMLLAIGRSFSLHYLHRYPKNFGNGTVCKLLFGMCGVTYAF